MRKLHFFSILVALSLATSSLWALPTGVVNGKLPCKFTVSAGGQQVYFSQGNLQYNSNTQTWQFASEQYEYIGNTEGNTNINTDGKENNTGIADLFGWVGASSTWTGLKQYGLTSSNNTNSTNGYGNKYNDNLKSDWGTLMGTGWFTMSLNEWHYIFNSRTGDKAATVNGTANIRYTKATINTDNGTGGIKGVILFPDGGTFAASEFYAVGS